MDGKIMFYKNNNGEVCYALPTSFYELKLLVDTGYCVMDRDDIDLWEWFSDCDWFYFMGLDDLTYEDCPHDIDFCDELKAQMIELEGFYYNFACSCLITQDDLETQFEQDIEYIMQNEIRNAQYAREEELSYQRWRAEC